MSEMLESAELPGTAERPGETGYRFARRFGVLAGDLGANGLEVFVRGDCDPQALLELRRRSGHPLCPVQLDDDSFAARLRERYERSSNDAMQFVEGLGDDADLMSVAQSLSEPEDLLESQDEAPIIRLINALLAEAVKENASDIHIEPFENRLSVRFRVDGVLREVLEPPRALALVIVSRIKVMAKLDIAEKRLPQDGRIGLRLVGRSVDVRVSTLPSGYGERVVLRLLDKQAGRLELRQLGMGDGHYEAMERIISKPHGIVLVTGPTGSGKTTTLYSALMRLNDRSRNILTVEDPIEYYLDGIGQTQINAKVDMTFARGLRAILRQDPDVVMVGEIRDVETVQIAIQASLTGHLVFSTLHTNTAVGAITRLRDMGIEPFLLSSTLNGVLAQRLVRTLCRDCRQAHPATPAECQLLGVDPQSAPLIYRPAGCDSCNGSGYRGRTGIYEVIEVDDTLRGLIHDGASEQSMLRHARLSQQGIRQDGLRRVLDGQTTLEEVLRVTRED